MLSKIKISQKVYILGAVQLFLICLVGGVGYSQMAKIGVELVDIAEEDIPLTAMLTRLTEHQLQEAILFERALRGGLSRVSSPSQQRADVDALKVDIDKLVSKSTREFDEIEAFIEEGIPNLHSQAAVFEYKELLTSIERVEENYNKLKVEANQTLGMIFSNIDNQNLIDSIAFVEEQRDDIDHDLIEILGSIQQFTLTAARQAEQDEITGIRLITGLLIFSLIIAISFPYYIAKSISRPLVTLNERMEQIATGDGDLTQSLSERYQDETGDIARSFNVFIVKLRHIINDITSSVEVLDSTSKTASGEMLVTLDNIEKQRNEIEMVASSVNQMNSTTHDVATNTNNASQMAGNVRDSVNNGQKSAEESHQIVQQLAEEIETASSTIGSLAEKTDGIGMVLDTIRAIAEQTNLLALNAAIEAARAGESGRGFAVVADEVRSLAQRTQSSTGDIQTLVEGLQEEAKNAVACMDKGSESTEKCLDKSREATDAFEEVSQIVNNISALNAQIATAAEEQSAVATEVNNNLASISNIATATSDGALNTSKANEIITSGLCDLRQHVHQFRT
ncbi:methyl-accepting chemotaxis protein [Psychrobium sp. nBUS_13]|uniref:methyl-accepting chemotaxis protein n=1 Tax=Psychrobium sp. nBUS_13 TaxID=3395319 RepID=UPI003EB93221